jgi:hypothetical protein
MGLALEVREVAAVDLVARGQLDPQDALALVACRAWRSWLPPSLPCVRGRRASGAARRSGCVRSSWSITVGRGLLPAVRVGCPKSTVGTWIRKRQRETVK